MLFTAVGWRGHIALQREVRRLISRQKGHQTALVNNGGQGSIVWTSPEFHRFFHAPCPKGFWGVSPSHNASRGFNGLSKVASQGRETVFYRMTKRENTCRHR